MKLLLLSLCLVGTWAFPAPEEVYRGQSNGLGNYQFESVDEAGTRLSESGVNLDINGKTVNVKQGDFSYVAPDTKEPISETWRADEKGFKPYGAHLPTPPPIPPEISKSLAERNVNPPFGPGSLIQARSLNMFEGHPYPAFIF